MTLPPGRYSLGGGLMLLVRSESSRQWVVRYRFAGTRKDLSIGGASRISITSAKARAAKILSMAADGIDPSSSKLSEEDARESITFKEFYSGAIATIQNVKRWKNEKHASQWVSTIETYAVPVLGALRVKDITRGDILEVLKPIWDSKSETASRLRGRLEAVFSYAIATGKRVAANPATWRGNLDLFLPPPSRVQKVEHHEALSLDETRALLEEWNPPKSISASAIVFGILTASRVGEFVKARWDEIDFDARVWSVPPERRKDQKPYPHRVPLSDQAVYILSQIERKGEYVFARSAGSHISLETPRVVLQKKVGHGTMHGFRSTFRDWAAENGIDQVLAEKSLMHATGNEVEQAYQRSDLLEQRRTVMKAWADTIMPKNK